MPGQIFSLASVFLSVVALPRRRSKEHTMVHRDATYSVETQEALRELLSRLTSVDGWNEDEGVHALSEDVIGRWDANEATEIEA